MAVKTITQDVNFQGLSSDEKPGGPNGATFHVIDTGEVLVCHEGAWPPDLRLARALKQIINLP